MTNLYEYKSLHNKIFLKRKLCTLEMSGTTLVIEHINTLQPLFSQLSVVEHNIEEKEYDVQSLLDSYDHLIMNMVNGALRTMLVFNDVAATVLKEESRY